MNDRLKTIRERLKKTLKDVEAETGIENSHYSMMERGKRKVTDRTVKLLASVYGVDENWLRTGEGEMFSQTKQPVVEPSILEYEASVEEFVEAASKLPRELQELLIKIGAGLSAKNGFPPLGYRTDGSVDRGNSQQD
ncbi:MAG: helix-turn-helix transcriptional regulator [Thermoguttaceae bacterium]|nr:helix-turn-helix transcriptional regulator [Thermoguttaceae bacterium]